MKAAVQVLAVASAFTAVYAQNSAVPIIQSPASLVVCQPALLSFSGGTAPYYISVLPGAQPSAAALEQFPAQSGNSYTWNVNLAAGQSITLAIRDSTGAINYSSELSIQSGTDTSCIGQSLTGSGSSTPGGAATSSASNSFSTSVRTTSSIPLATSSSSASRSSSSSSSSGVVSSAASGASSVASQAVSGASSVAGQVTSAAAAVTSAVTGGASTKYVANAAGIVGVAALVAFFA